MAAGHLVFPAIMTVAILFVSGYVIGTPATPAPEDPQQRLIRVEPGDQLLLEVTGYYGAPDNRVFFSTQEERHDALPRGDVFPQLQESPVSYTLSDEPPEAAQGLDKSLLGRRPGDRFTTPVIEPSRAFGDWQEQRTLPRAVGALPIRVDFNSDSQLQAGRRFNATEYQEYFAEEGYELRPGLVWPCEDSESVQLWRCRLLHIDVARNEVSYERIIQDGDSYPLDAILDVNTGRDEEWNFTVRRTRDQQQFQLLLDPPVGTTFQLRQALREPYAAGTYHVLSTTDDQITVRYSSASNVNPLLVGQSVQYDIVILRILRR